jgi:hypothetical protein
MRELFDRYCELTDEEFRQQIFHLCGEEYFHRTQSVTMITLITSNTSIRQSVTFMATRLLAHVAELLRGARPSVPSKRHCGQLP